MGEKLFQLMEPRMHLDSSQKVFSDAALYDNPSAGDLYGVLPLEQSTVTEEARFEG